MNKMNETASSLWHQRGFKCWKESLEIGSAKHFTNPRETFFGFEWYSAPASRRQYCLSQFTTSHFKITKMVRALWLAERSVCMRVCKHGCGVKMFCFSRANHASTNLKTFWVENSTSLLYLPIPSSAELGKPLQTCCVKIRSQVLKRCVKSCCDVASHDLALILQKGGLCQALGQCRIADEKSGRSERAKSVMFIWLWAHEANWLT